MCQENQGLLGHPGTWALKDSKACLVRTAYLDPKATWALQAPQDSQEPRVNEVCQDQRENQGTQGSRVFLVLRDTRVSQAQKATLAMLGYLACLVQWVHKELRECQGSMASRGPGGPQEYLGSEAPSAPPACREPLVQKASQEHQDCQAQQVLLQKA